MMRMMRMMMMKWYWVMEYNYVNEKYDVLMVQSVSLLGCDCFGDYVGTKGVDI